MPPAIGSSVLGDGGGAEDSQGKAIPTRDRRERSSEAANVAAPGALPASATASGVAHRPLGSRTAASRVRGASRNEPVPRATKEDRMLRRKARSWGVVWLLFTMLLLSSCRTDWATWGFGHERQGDNRWESTVGPQNAARLHQQWATNLDGSYINASPIVALDVNVRGKRTDVIYVGTEHGIFFALNT